MTWVMFDYGGVVSHPPTRQDLALLAGVAGAEVPAFEGGYWKWRRAYDLAELDVTGYWRQVGHSLGRSFGEASVAELARLDCASWLRLQPGSVALIEELAAGGLPLALLSNAPDQLAGAISELPIARHFSQLIFSCQLKYAKPDPRCYSGALARIGVTPEQIIFIDDRSENVTAAAAMGLQALHFTSSATIRRAVIQRLAGPS